MAVDCPLAADLRPIVRAERQPMPEWQARAIDADIAFERDLDEMRARCRATAHANKQIECKEERAET